MRRWAVQRAAQRAALQLATFHTLPVVDIEALGTDSTAEERLEAGRALHDAAKNVGFFYVQNHGVCLETAKEARDRARSWFAQDDTVKQRIEIRESEFRGYQRIGSNVTRYAEGDGGFTRDHHEAIDLYREHALDSVEVRSGKPLHGLNRWPDDSPAFVEALKAWQREAEGLSHRILRGLGLGLGLGEECFDSYHRQAFWVLRVIHYPQLPAEARRAIAAARRAQAGNELARSVPLSVGEHTDYGLLTVVNQDEEHTALQVKNASGHWIDAEPVPGAFVCNIGDCLALLSNGMYQSTLHRVVHDGSGADARISVPYFHEPDFDAVITPMTELVTSERPLVPHERLVYGEHLQSKVRSNFELNRA